ncbi:MAG: sigma-70 family RNA polymerase sigma factor [Bdellovibrionales bacterium]|nr:sigma-70 family RNA polymerase sigma factor [Bdellovibrionales bacterium]
MGQSSEKQADLALIKKIQKGDDLAFMELVEKYETKVFHLAMRFTRNHEDAEEVLQDVFSTIHRKLHLFEGKSAFSSWLYRIVVNAAFMKLRKRRQQPAVSLEDLAPALRQQCLDGESITNNQTDDYTLNREMREILRDAINRLPDQYRDVFVLRDVNGLSNQEVSEILTLSIPAVKSRLHRSRLMLRKKLQRYYAEFVGPRAYELASEAAAALA